MTKVLVSEPQKILAGIPEVLRAPLLEEYSKLVRNYREGRWEPAELSAGKLCEIVYSILKGHVDGVFPSAPAKPSNMVDACNALASNGRFPRSVRIQIPRMLIALYEIRNNRNVGHVGADVDPSHLDATVVLAMAKWILAELVRIFHGTTTEVASDAVEALSERSLPIVWKGNSVTRVLGAHLSAKEKTLALLYGIGTADVATITKSIGYSNLSQFRRAVLQPAHKADLIHFDPELDSVEISPVGIRYVEENISLVL